MPDIHPGATVKVREQCTGTVVELSKDGKAAKVLFDWGEGRGGVCWFRLHALALAEMTKAADARREILRAGA